MKSVAFQMIWHTGFSLFAVYVFNLLNVKFDEGELSLIYYTYGIFVSSTFVVQGLKEYFVFTAIQNNLFAFMRFNFFVSTASLSVFMLVIGSKLFTVFSNEVYGGVAVSLALVLIYFFCVIGEIVGHVMVSQGKQYLPMLARACPPVGLFLYCILSDRIEMIDFLFFSSVHYFVVILLFFLVSEETKFEEENKKINVKKAISFSMPFNVSGGITFLYLSAERTLWLSFSSDSFLTFQAYLMLQGASFNIAIFPIINRVWGDFNKHQDEAIAFDSVWKFQVCALCGAIFWFVFGDNIASVVFPSYELDRIAQVVRLFGIFAFLVPTILNTLLIGRIFVSKKSNKAAYVVDISAAILSLIFCLVCGQLELWPGYIIIFSNITIGTLMVIYWFVQNGLTNNVYWAKFMGLNGLTLLGVIYAQNTYF